MELSSIPSPVTPHISKEAPFSFTSIPLHPLSLSTRTLPAELIKLITTFLDVPSAVIFARASRLFNALVEPRIWRDLDLSLTPLGVARLEERRRDGGKDWYEEDGKLIYPSRIEVHRRVTSISQNADPRRLGMVRKVSIIHAPGSNNRIAMLLEDVSPNLESLVISEETIAKGGTLRDPLVGTWALSVQPIHLPLLRYNRELEKCGRGIHFPALTHIDLSHDRAHSVSGFVPLICSWAPNLLSLRFVITHPETSLSPLFPRTIMSETKIQQLAFIYSWPGPGQDYERDVFDLVLALLRHSPMIQGLSVGYSGLDETMGKTLLDAIAELENLTSMYCTMSTMGYVEDQEDDGEGEYDGLDEENHDLHCEAGGETSAVVEGEEDEAEFTDGEDTHLGSDVEHIDVFEDVLEEQVPQFSSLTLLILSYNGCLSPDRYAGSLPRCPILTRLQFALYAPIQLPPTSTPLPLNSEFAAWLRDTPTLHQIRFHLYDERVHWMAFPVPDGNAEKSATGSIWSIRHGDDELVGIHLAVREVEVVDERYYDGDRTVRKRYVQSVGVESWLEDMPVVERHGPSVQEWSDFEGMAVPREVIERMREVEGASEAEWEKRGVEVGAAAWEVLTDWREGKEVVLVGSGAAIEGNGS